MEKAVLLDVVPQAESERGVDLGLDRLADRSIFGARGGGPTRAGRSRAARRSAGAAGSPGRGRLDGARSRPARAGRRAGVGSSSSQTSSSSVNRPARASTGRRQSRTNEWPSKTSSSWPPTSPQKANAARSSRARRPNISSRWTPFAGVVGRGREVDDQACAAERLGAGRGARLPDVLADGQPDPVGTEVEQAVREPGVKYRRSSKTP